MTQGRCYVFALTLIIGMSTFGAAASTDVQALGYYSKGHLQAADAMPLSGPGFIKVFLSRDRKYSTSDLKDIVTGAADKLRQEFPDGEKLQIGDVAAFKGGQLSSHASHQNGLDADLSYFKMDHKNIPSSDIGFPEIFVKAGKPTANFDYARNWRFINLLASTGRINRIFVDTAIKRAFCAYAKKLNVDLEKSAALHVMEPWPNHQNHMHVRINCPSADQKCVAQQPLPAGSGCGRAFEIQSADSRKTDLED